jgi:hypothetical protein
MYAQLQQMCDLLFHPTASFIATRLHRCLGLESYHQYFFIATQVLVAGEPGTDIIGNVEP